MEILSEIFLLAVQSIATQKNLMLVSWRWYATMLFTPGMLSVVRICNSTQKEDSGNYAKEDVFEQSLVH
jgi:hypothetical protein